MKSSKFTKELKSLVEATKDGGYGHANVYINYAGQYSAKFYRTITGPRPRTENKNCKQVRVLAWVPIV